MLFLVATPIGNLSDITLRALETLKKCDLILCEDTRHSSHLLAHYQIEKPLLSYHKFNEKEQLDPLLERLRRQENICLISDAGTPLIADPGFILVERCIQEGIPVEALPGPCALIQALILSGLSYEKFQFIGFLPKKEKELLALLQEIVHYSGVTICYESPHRILSTLETLNSLSPQIQCVFARELTKKFETVWRGTPTTLLEQVKTQPPKGECVLIIQGEKEKIDYSTLTLEEHVEHVEKSFKVSKREAIKIVADLRHLNKRELYRSFHFPKEP